MSEELDTHQKLEDASHALCNWMRSQGFEPGDGVMLCAWFVARLIVENATSEDNLQEKLRLHGSTICTFIDLQQKALGR